MHFETVWRTLMHMEAHNICNIYRNSLSCKLLHSLLNNHIFCCIDIYQLTYLWLSVSSASPCATRQSTQPWMRTLRRGFPLSTCSTQFRGSGWHSVVTASRWCAGASIRRRLSRMVCTNQRHAELKRTKIHILPCV